MIFECRKFLGCLPKNIGAIVFLVVAYILLSQVCLQASSTNSIHKPNWETEFKIEPTKISLKQFVQQLNVKVGSNIKISDELNIHFTLEGSDSAINILKFVLNKTGTKLVVLGGDYTVVNDPNKSIEIVSNVKTSSSKRLIGTVVLDDKYSTSSATVWQIVTTNSNVSGYHAYMELDTGNIGASDEIDRGEYNQSTGYVTVKHFWWKYPALQLDLQTTEDTFRISGANVVDTNGKIIGKFHSNKFLITKNQTIPKTEGCDKVWGDSSKQVYYTKDSQNFTDFPYSRYITYFCSEESAKRIGYKKSLN